MNDLGVEDMKVGDLKPLVERAYREMAPLQWVREVTKNAGEAGATMVRFTVEMQAVEKRGLYRRLIIDNGCGMDADELVAFMNKFGGGGKPIGGVHENFGIGAKSGLLPWNKYGVVVLSYRDGQLALIWLRFDERRQTYGLRRFEVPNGDGESVITPVLEHDGSSPIYLPGEPDIDWSQIAPKWAREHGTAIVLLGNPPGDDTALGDPRNASERDTKAITKYLNSRFWVLPDHLSEIRVDEFRSTDRSNWPRNAQEATQATIQGKNNNRRFNNREIKGAKTFITLDAINYDKSKTGKLAGTSTVGVPGAKIEWFLWEGIRPEGQHQIAEENGYIAVQYRDELYGLSRHPLRTRAFGLGFPDVQRRTWLIIHPEEYDERTDHGVYPRGDRSDLLISGGTEAGRPLPYVEWGEAFVAAMPEVIADAIRRSFTFEAASIDDAKWKDRLKDRFGKRWRMIVKKIVGHEKGTIPFDQTGTGGSRHGRGVGGGGGAGEGGNPGTNIGPTTPMGVKAPSSKLLGREMSVGGGLPDYLPLPRAKFMADDDPLREARVLASWHPTGDPDPNRFPDGCVWVNQDHAVIQEQTRTFMDAYSGLPMALEELERSVRSTVIAVYGEVAVSRIAHLLGGARSRLKLDQSHSETMLSDESLTFSLLGLMAEDQMISTRLGKLGSKVGAKRASPSAA